MITLSSKQKIILMHINGKSNRSIATSLGMSKDTVNKYVIEYEAKKEELMESNPGMDRTELIQEIVEKPKYDSSNRKSIKVTDEIEKEIEDALELNRIKRASGRSKQIKRKIDIYEDLVAAGYDISYSTVKRITNKIEQRNKEAFIRQEYELGDVCEFDWGEVKLDIGNQGFRKYQMAVFTPAKSNYRFARLYPAQDTPAFQQSHSEFFEHSKGAFNTLVYDNMKVAVKRFVGLNEKEPTKGLSELSIYYGFNFRFCNIASGNEKGHVERSVEFVRRKAFSGKNEHFDTLADANRYLDQKCLSLNSMKQSDGHIAMEIFDQERSHLLPYVPPFESCTIRECRVDKYSTVTFKQNHYSVPDNLVGKILTLRGYTDKIVIYHDNEIVTVHSRSYKNHDWVIKLNHYLKTLYKKPGALANSTALLQADTKIKNIYEKYYTKDAKVFLEVLEVIYEKGVDAVYDALRELERTSPLEMSADKVRMTCDHAFEKKQSVTYKYDDPISLKTKKTLSQYDLLAKLQCSDVKEAVI